MTRVAVLFADGFEDIEAIAVVDVLRRGGCEVLMTGVETETVRSSHDVEIKMNTTLTELSGDLDAVVLPGGLPGAENLKNSSSVLDLLKETHKNGNIVAAICAAPMALEAAGLTTGILATCYPGFEKDVASANMTGERVVRDGQIITGNGPGSAIEFALEILRALDKAETADALKAGMQVYAP